MVRKMNDGIKIYYDPYNETSIILLFDWYTYSDSRALMQATNCVLNGLCVTVKMSRGFIFHIEVKSEGRIYQRHWFSELFFFWLDAHYIRCK